LDRELLRRLGNGGRRIAVHIAPRRSTDAIQYVAFSTPRQCAPQSLDGWLLLAPARGDVINGEGRHPSRRRACTDRTHPADRNRRTRGSPDRVRPSAAPHAGAKARPRAAAHSVR
jgi:hypothetical protein